MFYKSLTMAAAMGFVAMLALPSTAAAGQQDFTLENNTGYTISEVYVSPSESEAWGDDVLDVDVLEADDTVDISFDRREDVCEWDVKVVYDDGDTAVWNNFDFCTISTVGLFYEHSSGKTWAKYE